MQLRFTLHGAVWALLYLFCLLSVCGATMRQSYRDIAMVILVGPLLAVVVAIALGKAFGSF